MADVSYAIPLLANIISKFSSQHAILDGPYSLGRYSLVVNLFGFLYLAFAVITFNFPTVSPVTSDNMNYTSPAIGIIMLISLITWVTTGRKHFTGPEAGALLEGKPVSNGTGGVIAPEK